LLTEKSVHHNCCTDSHAYLLAFLLSVTLSGDDASMIPRSSFFLFHSNQYSHLLSLQHTGGPKVYDVTAYLDDHPGGAEVMLDVAGQDADEFFEDIGHSKEARAELKKYLIGNFKMDEATQRKLMEQAEAKAKQQGSSGLQMFGVLVVLLAVLYGYYHTKMQPTE
jgi:cytochrome b5